MSGVNKVILVGYLGRDPEAKSFQNGGEMVRISLATSEQWKDRASGERKARTEWHTVIVTSEALVKVAKQYLRKGSHLYVEGQLRTRKWQDQSGADRYSTEVVLGGFNAALVLLDKAQGDPGRSDYSGYADTPGAGGPGGGDELDDDIPF